MRVNFTIAFALAFLGVLLFPHIHLLYFAPFLVLTFYKKSRFAVLWRAIGCGLILDLFSSTPQLGLTALNYCLVCWVLYGQRHNFFEDKPFTLPLMTFFFSILSTLIGALTALFLSHPLHLSFRWFLTDFLCMPLFDAFTPLFSLSPSI